MPHLDEGFFAINPRWCENEANGTPQLLLLLLSKTSLAQEHMQQEVLSPRLPSHTTSLITTSYRYFLSHGSTQLKSNTKQSMHRVSTQTEPHGIVNPLRPFLRFSRRDEILWCNSYHVPVNASIVGKKPRFYAGKGTTAVSPLSRAFGPRTKDGSSDRTERPPRGEKRTLR